MENKRCDKHDQEIMKIQTEFGHFKKEVSAKLDELFDEIRKPILTEKEKATLIISLVVYLVKYNFSSFGGDNALIILGFRILPRVKLTYYLIIVCRKDSCFPGTSATYKSYGTHDSNSTSGIASCIIQTSSTQSDVIFCHPNLA